MMKNVKDSIWSFGENIPSYARRYGHQAECYARSVGWKRGGIALGVLGTAIAVPFIVRAVKNRRRRQHDAERAESRDAYGMYERRAEPAGTYVHA